MRLDDLPQTSQVGSIAVCTTWATGNQVGWLQHISELVCPTDNSSKGNVHGNAKKHDIICDMCIWRNSKSFAFHFIKMQVELQHTPNQLQHFSIFTRNMFGRRAGAIEAYATSDRDSIGKLREATEPTLQRATKANLRILTVVVGSQDTRYKLCTSSKAKDKGKREGGCRTRGHHHQGRLTVEASWAGRSGREGFESSDAKCSKYFMDASELS